MNEKNNTVLDMNTEFKIGTLTRADVYQETQDERAKNLTDDEMRALAENMHEAHLGGGAGFWGDLVILFDEMMEDD